ncbi:MAG: hypothetical protein ACOVO3_12100, partial [Fluviicola sp.]
LDIEAAVTEKTDGQNIQVYVNDPVVSGSATKKNDIHVAAGANIGNLSSGLHGHASYAFTNNAVIVATATGYSGSCTTKNFDYADSSTSVQYTGRKFGIGTGYYRPLSNNNFIEVLAGGQFGISENERNSENYEYRYIKYFVQPGFYQYTEHFQVGFYLRTGLIDYLNFPTGANHEIQKVSTNSPIFYVDPSFSMCVGGKMTKVGVQVNYTLSTMTSVGMYKLGLYLGDVVQDPLSLSFFLRFSIPSKAQN